MKYSLQWIIKHKGTFDFEEEITFPCEMFEKYAHINGLKDVIVSGTGNLDTRDKRLYVDLNIKGTMILPCALTLEDVDIHLISIRRKYFHLKSLIRLKTFMKQRKMLLILRLSYFQISC